MKYSALITDIEGIISRTSSVTEQSAACRSQLYQDVVSTLSQWQHSGIKLYVYSSDVVHAQQLLFNSDNLAKLTPLFSGYFDSRIGARHDISSYAAILQQLQLPPKQLLFISDVITELDAARMLDIGTIQLIREGQSSGDHATVHCLADVQDLLT